jgi:hypothetical protein
MALVATSLQLRRISRTLHLVGVGPDDRGGMRDWRRTGGGFGAMTGLLL